jgi:hypothetical protein
MKPISVNPRPSASDSPKSSLLKKIIPGLVFGFVVFIILFLVGDLSQAGDQIRDFQ